MPESAEAVVSARSEL